MATTLAGDAEMKQLLVGTWKESFPYGVTTIVLKSDGSRIDNGHDYPSGKPYSISGKWDVKDGNFIQIRNYPEGDRYYTIISLTQHKFVLKDNAHGRHTGTWTR